MSDTNKIVKLAEFQRVLKDYRPNIEVVDLINQIKFVFLVAPAGAGRNTLIHNLIMTGKYYYLISDTTRQPRINNGVLEYNGAEYWYKTEREILDSLRRGEYLEAALIHNQQISGISIHELRTAIERQLIAITDIDIQGGAYLHDFGLEADFIFILPPDFDEWMRRLDSRGKMDPHEKKRRLQSAKREIKQALDAGYYKFVVNWDLRATSEELHHEVMSEKFDPDKQEMALHHAEQLLKALEHHT